MQVALQRKRLCLDRSSEASGFIVGEQLNMTMNKFSLQILGSLGNSRRARRVQATWRFCNASAEVVTGKYQDFLCNKVYEELESLTTLNFGLRKFRRRNQRRTTCSSIFALSDINRRFNFLQLHSGLEASFSRTMCPP